MHQRSEVKSGFKGKVAFASDLVGNCRNPRPIRAFISSLIMLWITVVKEKLS